MAPRARVCYICGRQYMLHSFPIHEPQCRALFEQREATKPEKERRPCPTDPLLSRSSSSGSGKRISSRAELDEVNAQAMAAWSSGSLAECRFCARRFLPEKLAIHNRACTAAHPSRRVDEPVSRRPPAQQLADTLPTSTHPRDYNSNALSLKLQALAQLANGPLNFGAGAARHARPKHRASLGATVGEAGFSLASIGLEEESVQGDGPSVGATSATQSLLPPRGSIGRLRAVAGTGGSSSSSNRLRGHGGRQTFTNIEDSSSPSQPPQREEKWKAQSRQFRNAMKLARIAALQERGLDASHIMVPSPEREEDTRIECPHCHRRYSEQAAARHVPLCRDILNKPRSLFRGNSSSGNGSGNGGVGVGDIDGGFRGALSQTMPAVATPTGRGPTSSLVSQSLQAPSMQSVQAAERAQAPALSRSAAGTPKSFRTAPAFASPQASQAPKAKSSSLKGRQEWRDVATPPQQEDTRAAHTQQRPKAMLIEIDSGPPPRSASGGGVGGGGGVGFRGSGSGGSGGVRRSAGGGGAVRASSGPGDRRDAPAGGGSSSRGRK